MIFYEILKSRRVNVSQQFFKKKDLVSIKKIFEFFYHIFLFSCLKSERNKNFENVVQNIPLFLLTLYIYIYIQGRNAGYM